VKASYLRFCALVHRTFHNCGKLLGPIHVQNTKRAGGNPFGPETPLPVPSTTDHPGCFCGQDDSSGVREWKGLWKNRTGVRSELSTGLRYALYQGFFKVREAISAPERTAPILSEAQSPNNARAEVIHRLYQRESWVFHIIHRFQTFLTDIEWNNVTRTWKPRDRACLKAVVAFDTCSRRSVQSLGSSVRASPGRP